jgi:hypothetical protein
LEAEVANAIESAEPGRVVRVGEPVKRPDGSDLTDFDISGDDFVVEVASGGGKGKTSQLAVIKRAAEGRRVAIYGPKIGGAVAKGIEAQGIPVFRDINALIELIKGVK